MSILTLIECACMQIAMTSHSGLVSSEKDLLTSSFSRCAASLLQRGPQSCVSNFAGESFKI